MKRLIWPVGLGLILVAGAGLGYDLATGQSDHDQRRRQLVDDLTALAREQELQLSVDQRQLVTADCLLIQAQDLNDLSRNFLANRPRYQQALDRVAGYIWSTTDWLYDFKQDASVLNQAMVDLIKVRQALVAALSDYGLSLDRVSRLNCQAYPVLFVAGWQQLEIDYRQLAEVNDQINSLIRDRLPQQIDQIVCQHLDPADSRSRCQGLKL